MNTSIAFDPVKFKETTRAQWESAAEPWNRWGPFIGRWLGQATEEMLDMARVRSAARVLDVAAGAGEQPGLCLKSRGLPAVTLEVFSPWRLLARMVACRECLHRYVRCERTENRTRAASRRWLAWHASC